MLFEIRRVKNGCVLKVKNSSEESVEREEIVYQEKYDDDIECFADFLCYLNDEYGPATSRYSEKRIYISVAPGDKFEDARSGPEEGVVEGNRHAV